MDIYLTAKSNGERLRFPLLPDRLNVKTGALPVSFQIIKLGEARIPRGTALTGYSWNGIFPGQSMSDASFVFDWQEPNRIVSLLKEWEGKGETLTLMVTETTINADVFIEGFTFEHYGIDNVSYTLNLTQIRELYVETTPPPPVPPEPPKEEKPEEQKQYGTVKTNGSNLNVRKSASTSSSIIGKLKNGSRTEILGKTGNWYIIPWSSGTGGKGYIYASYVKLDGSGSSGGGSSSSSKKSSSSSSSSKKKTTTAKSSTSSTATKKSLTISKPASTLINAAKTAVKKVVTKVSAAVSSLFKKKK